MSTKKNILILGGLGFIGKNLYAELISQGHHVTLVAPQAHSSDSFITSGVKENLLIGNTLDVPFLERVVTGKDVIFSFAGSSGAADSIRNPYQDLDTNLRGHLNILESCRKFNPRVLLVFPSSRLVYGKPLSTPVSENHPLQPESIYAIHKITTEQYYLLYQRLYNINCVIFRISNPYGPHQKFGSNHYGVLNWFIHKALSGEPIEIFGEGNQMRDFIHVRDVVSLCNEVMYNEALWNKIFNIGYGSGVSIKQTVDTILKLVPTATALFKPWPEIDKKIETGDYISDLSYLKQFTHWHPVTKLEEGLRETINFYANSK